jgi:predicted outer membrane repeat protein
LNQGALGGGIFNSKTLTLNGVTVQDNQIPNGTAGGIANAPTGIMTLTNVTLSGNQAAIGGGSLTAGTALVDKLTVSGNHTSMAEAGFANGGAASLSNILVQGNSSGDINGGLGNGAFMTLTNALIRDNKAVNVNGGFANIGVARLENVTISGNSASSAGGLGNLSSLQMTNSTISGNHALGGGLLKPEHQGLGGGLANGALAKLTNATISNNSATGSGGGIASDASVVAAEQDRAATIELVLGCPGPNCRPFVFPTSPPTALLQNTLVANSPHGSNCFGVITSLGFNLSSDNSCNFARPGDLTGTNPRLGRLQNNGGPTLGDARDRNTPFRGAVATDDNVATDDTSFGPGRGSPTLTQALLDDSPAIDAIPVASCTTPGTDQRGVERPQGAGCDIGAFEAEPDERGGDNQGDNHSDN